ncbi:cold shock domain-containing protein [Olivibacter sp. SDN3]|uniref:cold shock domain-containing protein n=1 Tax=Olivibacter sp. SDN3 TaxID=2764720 RepID=UPI001651A0E7|nr:cold shock domain-containing protein [Olivibacter sp. SDN3]QNL49603.1 cold shock domain-containing protein [Olivibacter sp. SDN3]
MELGVIKWFNNLKGFGVADTIDGQVFIHIKSFKVKPANIENRSIVLFKKRIDPKSQNTVAIHSRLIGAEHDWDIIATYALKTLAFRKTTKPTGHYDAHLAEIAALQYLNGKSKDQILNSIKIYYANHLADRDFISYCEFLEKVFTRSMGIDKRNELLTLLYNYFGESINERKLFYVWKAMKFGYIGYTDADDFEIPEQVLYSFSEQIDASDLIRIHAYSYGESFCKELIDRKLDDTKKLSTEEIKKYEMLSHVKFSKE